MDRFSVPEAAERLGVTQDAVRKRIHRDAIQWEQDEDGRYYVWIDPNDTTRTTRNTFRATQDDTSRDTYIDALKFQVDILQRELEDRKEEARRYQHLLAAALERIPAIEEAPPEARESPVSAPEERVGTDDVPPEGQGQEKRTSWWRRLFSSG